MLWPLLDVDPNAVRAGWLPLGLVVLLGLAIVGLFLSMRHEMKKINAPWRKDLPGAEDDHAAAAGPEDGRAEHDEVIDAGTAPHKDPVA